MRWVIAWLVWAARRIGYVIRPYDMLADRRRWCWQPRQPCGRQLNPAGNWIVPVDHEFVGSGPQCQRCTRPPSLHPREN